MKRTYTQALKSVEKANVNPRKCIRYFHMIQGYVQYIISNNNQNRYTGKA